MASNKELKEQIEKSNFAHIDEVVNALKQDPNCEGCNCDDIVEYLVELREKHGSLIAGIQTALEIYLQK